MQDVQLDNIEKFWQEFLTATNKDSSTRYIEYFHFDLTQEIANDLLAMVLAGAKKATVGSLLAYECKGERVPQVGDYSIVTDWEGSPHCVIETTNVAILPFSEITYDICKREGEDDTLESWQKSHRRFFMEEGKILGYEFTESMPVVFEDFRVVFEK